MGNNRDSLKRGKWPSKRVLFDSKAQVVGEKFAQSSLNHRAGDSIVETQQVHAQEIQDMQNFPDSKDLQGAQARKDKHDAQSKQGGLNQAPENHQVRGVICAFLGAACWGFSANCVSWLTSYTDATVWWLGNMRLICAGFLFTLYVLFFDRARFCKLFKSRKLLLQLLLYSVVGVVLMQISYMSAIKYTNPGTALLLQEVGVPLILALTCLRMRRLPTKLELFALMLAIFGILAISTQGSFSSLGINPLGLIWGLISGVALTGYNIIPTTLIRECGLAVTNAASMIVGSLLLTPFVQPWNDAPSMNLEAWMVFAGVVIVGTMFAYVIYLRGVVDAGPVRASLMGVFEPVSGALIATIWLGIAFSSWDFIGGTAIIAMMIIVAKHPSQS